MSHVAAPPRSPYKGLTPFEDTELDALLFFGRERDRDVIVANLLASRLTLLYGESGVGKSSVLRAGVVRALRELAPDATVVVHDTWSDDPGSALAALRDAQEAYLILDQFEEYFVYHGHEGALLEELPDLLRESRVHVLIALREDALAQLDVFKARLPSVFANQLRLEHLDRGAARAAILGPVSRWSELAGERVEVEPELVDAVLDEVATGKVVVGTSGVGAIEEAAREERIEAPYLQLVMERIWDAERGRGSDTLRLATLRELGGAETIVREHVERALDELDAAEKDVAASMFDHLVTPSGTKIAHRAHDLAQYASVPEDTLARVLATLGRERILRAVDGAGAGGERYEIFHDVLAEPVLAWRLQRQLERERLEAERRHRRLVRVAVAATAAFAIVAALAIFAFIQWDTARSQARNAQARVLEANALAQIGPNPEQSLLRALDAARLEPSERAADVLRQALVAARLRLVLAARGPVRVVAYSPDGTQVLTASTDGRARLFDARTGVRLQNIWHTGRVVAAAFSPDGTLAVSGDDKGVARVWETATGRQLAVLREPESTRSVAFDEGGSLVLTASDDGTARLWEARTGQLVRIFRNPGPVALARLSPDGRVVATVARDGAGHVRARLFDARTGRLHRVLPERGVADVRFSHDGSLFVTTSRDGATRLYRPRDGKRLGVLDDHGKGVLAAAFSPDDKLLATAGDDGAVRIWTIGSRTRRFYFPGHAGAIVALSWSHDGRFVADASVDGTSRIWQVGGIEQGSSAAGLAGDDQAVTTVAFSPDGTSVVTGSDDGTARVWDARTEEVLELLGRHDGAVTSATFDARGDRVVSASVDGTARIWDVRRRVLLHTLRDGAPVEAASFSSDGTRVMTAGADGDVRISAAASGKQLRALKLGAPVLAGSFSPDGELVAAAGAGGRAALWRVADGRRVATIPSTGAAVDVQFSDDGKSLVVASRDRVTLWNVADSRPSATIGVPGGVVHAALSPDGSVVATAGADRLGRLFDARSGRLLHVLRGHKAPLTDVVFSPDGRRLITTSVDATPRVWDVKSGRRLQLLVGHFGTVTTAAFSPDGRWIATAGPISAGLWPARTGRIFSYLRGDTKLLTSVSFAPDGRHVVSSSEDGTVRIYDCEVCVDLDGLVRLADQRLARTARALTRAQRERYLRH